MNLTIQASFLASALLAWAPAGRAAQVLSSEADFLAALGASERCVNDFPNSDHVGQVTHPYVSGCGGFSYTVTTTPPLQLYALPGALSAVDTNDTLRFTFTTANVRTIGGLVYASDVSGVLTNGAVRLALSDGTEATVNSAAQAPAPFVGFVSSGPLLTNLTVRCETPGAYPTITHLFVAEGWPWLRIALTTSNTLAIVWPAPATGYRLEAASEIPSAPWDEAAPPPTTLGAWKQVLLALPSQPTFFRLRRH